MADIIPSDAIFVMYGSVACRMIVPKATSNVQIYVFQLHNVFFVDVFECPGTYYNRNSTLYGYKKIYMVKRHGIQFCDCPIVLRNISFNTLKKYLLNLLNLKWRFEHH